MRLFRAEARDIYLDGLVILQVFLRKQHHHKVIGLVVQIFILGDLEDFEKPVYNVQKYYNREEGVLTLTFHYYISHPMNL